MSREDSRLKIYTLGTIAFHINGVDITHRLQPKARWLLLFLVLESSNWFGRKRLADIFWPHLDEDASANNLRRTLHLIKSVIESPDNKYLDVTRGGVRFIADSDYWLDYNDLHLIKTECLCEKANPACRADIIKLIAVYKGDLFADDLPAVSEELSSWAETMKYRARIKAKRIFLEVTRCLMSSGRKSDAAIFIMQLAKLDLSDNYPYALARTIMQDIHLTSATDLFVPQTT